MYESKVDYETKSRLHLGVSGSIVKWNDERGVGVVKTSVIPNDIFFHGNVLFAKDQYVPQPNEAVMVYAKYDEQKQRWYATKITSPQREQWIANHQAKKNTLIQPVTSRLCWAVMVMVVWLWVVCQWSVWLGYWNIVLSLLTLVLYGVDKRRAMNNERNHRIAEQSLHVWALLGGWTGALIGRYLFRHKTRKQPFVTIFWVMVVCHMAITFYLMNVYLQK